MFQACNDLDPVGPEEWSPSEILMDRAVEVGGAYAIEELGLSAPELGKMDTVVTGLICSDRRILWVQFYNPKLHQPLPEGLEVICGGFSEYFTVSIDSGTWTVVGHYANSE